MVENLLWRFIDEVGVQVRDKVGGDVGTIWGNDKNDKKTNYAISISFVLLIACLRLDPARILYIFVIIIHTYDKGVFIFSRSSKFIAELIRASSANWWAIVYAQKSAKPTRWHICLKIAAGVCKPTNHCTRICACCLPIWCGFYPFFHSIHAFCRSRLIVRNSLQFIVTSYNTAKTRLAPLTFKMVIFICNCTFD